jgi:hypothetical protein
MNQTTRNYLPHDYQPSNFDIICGRGPTCFKHPGNLAFRRVIEKYLVQYGATKNKFEKTAIVIEVTREALRSDGILRKVVRWCRIRKLWFELPGVIFRQKVGQTMRDALLRRNPQKRAIHKEKRALQRVCREHAAQQAVESLDFVENSSHRDGSDKMMNPLNVYNNDRNGGDPSERLNMTLSQVQPKFILPAKFDILKESDEISDNPWVKKMNFASRLNTEVFGGNKVERETSPLISNVKPDVDVCKKSHAIKEGEMFSEDDESDTCSTDWFGDIFDDVKSLD